MSFAARLVSFCIVAPLAALHAGPALQVLSPGGEVLTSGPYSEVVAWGDNEYGQTTVPVGLTGVRAIAAGHGHTIALKDDGTVVGWGANDAGQTSVPAGLSDVIALAAGGFHSVALKRDGSVVAWGLNTDGQADVPVGLSGVIAIAAGGYHTIVLQQDGSLVAWGDNDYRQSTIPAGLSGITAIAGGVYHTIAVRRDGTSVGWGYGTYNQTSTRLTISGFTTVAAGLFHSVALNQNGIVVPWGHGASYQHPWGLPSNFPLAVAIAAGRNHTVALSQNGTVVAFGENGYGQTIVPPELSGVTGIAAGGYHTVALKQDARDFGPLNVNVTSNPVTFSLKNAGNAALAVKSISLLGGQTGDFILDKSRTATSLAAGSATGVVIRFRPKAAGFRRTTLRVTTNDPGRPYFDLVLTGLGKTNTKPLISATILRAEATGPTGAVVDLNSQVRDEGDTGAPRVTFNPVSGSTFPLGTTTVSATAMDAAGLTATGSFIVSVSDTTAPRIEYRANISVPATQLDGAVVNYADAVVTDAVGVTSITYSRNSGSFFPVGSTDVNVFARDAAGNTDVRGFRVTVAPPKSSLAIYRDGQTEPEATASNPVQAWGNNADGQANTPAGVSGVVAIAAGADHTVVLKHDGRIAAWGRDDYGQCSAPRNASGVIAIGAGRDHTVALKQNGTVMTWGWLPFWDAVEMPSGLSGVSAIAVGHVHTVALKQDGTVVAWGWNASGQATVPSGLSSVAAIAAGGYHTIALRKDGSVTAWGSNSHGQVRVPNDLSGVVAIAAGAYHSVALKLDGSVVAWGSNSHGQTSVPSSLNGVIGIAAGGDHTMALKQDGSVVAWGKNDVGQIDVPPGLSGVVAIAAGSSHSVALQLPRAQFFVTRRGQLAQDVSLDLSSQGLLDVGDISATIEGPDAADFALVGAPLPPVLRPGETARLTLRFTPRRLGIKTAWLRIVSSDASRNPYLLGLTGLNSEQEISVESQGSLARGASIDFGMSALYSSYLSRTFTIRNVGSDTLDNLSIVVRGNAASDFKVTSLTSSSLLPGATQSFTMTFSPTALGLRTASMQIISNDGDENPFDVQLSGRGSSLDVVFAGVGGQSLLRPSQLIDLGTLSLGSKAERSFTLRNVSAHTLTGLGMLIEGGDASAFTISPSLPASLSPNESITFTVTFDANQESARSGRISLYSSQGFEEVIDLRATVSVARLELRHPAGVQIRGSNQLFASGNNEYGQTTIPPGLSNVTAVAAGYNHSVALKRDGTVVAWGYNGSGQTSVPSGLAGVVAIAAGYDYTVALKRDGTVVAWGYNGSGQTSVPPGLAGVTAIAAGGAHAVALKQDGTVVAWGFNGVGQTNVPAGALSDVKAIAAGYRNTIALKRNGSIVAWGENSYGQNNIPSGLSRVIAIAAGDGHTVALKQDGTVVAWGKNDYGQTEIPVGLSGVASIAAGYDHTVALKQDGTVVTWGYSHSRSTPLPTNLVGVTAIGTGYFSTFAVGNQELDFGATLLGTSVDLATRVFNAGAMALNVTHAVIEGPGASQFRIGAAFPFSTATSQSSPLTLTYSPRSLGAVRATLKIYSNDSFMSPFVVAIKGTGSFALTAAKAGTIGSDFTYGPLTVDPQTGLVLQKLTFTNRTGIGLYALQLHLSKLAAGVSVYSSSLGESAGTLNVIYSRPIQAGETISFTLCYSDPSRRTSSAIQPTITATALLSPEPRSDPVSGTLVSLLSVRDTINGPLLDWNVRANAVYVVEYSDDGGLTWFSAVHRLTKVGSRMMWVDRGQPETYFKPTSKADRKYRVKVLP